MLLPQPLLQPEVFTHESCSTAVPASASDSNSCQTVAASGAGTGSPPAGDALGSRSHRMVTPSSPILASSGSPTQQTASPPLPDNPPAPSVTSPDHDSLTQGLASHLSLSRSQMEAEPDRSVSGGDVAAEQAPVHFLDGAHAESLGPTSTASAPSQSASSSGHAEQPERSSPCNKHHHGKEEEQQWEQSPSHHGKEDKQLSEHFAPPILPLALPLAAGPAQEAVQQVQGYAQDTQGDASTHCIRDAACNPAQLPPAKAKPGILAKSLFCIVFSPVLVPVLAVGGCLQLYDALS